MRSTAADAKTRVLIIEDDPSALTFIEAVLAREPYRVESVMSGEAALQALDRELFDLVLLDLNLPGVGGMDVLEVGRTLQTDGQFIMMTGEGTVGSAVDAMKLGAFDYVTKPIGAEELRLVAERALRETTLLREVSRLRQQLGDRGRGGMVGVSGALARVLDLVQRVAPTRASVLLTGETGTGKELVARAIHDASDRSGGPFVAINCSAVPESLLESELFGYMKGSFTGAHVSRRGLFEEAHGGTVFLDEIATVSPPIQVKLLRVLQERRIQRIGGTQPVPVDFRLIAACNVELRDEVQAGRFREDLFYRLNIFPIEVPPLRDRRDDIPLLAAHFRLRFARENGVEPPEITPETMRRLVEYEWPGNVRELENFIERSVILHAGAPSIPFERPAHAPAARADKDLLGSAVREQWTLERLEREYILATLADSDGHQINTAEVLGINRRTLYRKLKQYRSSAA